jgi:prephenate dehydratase
MAAKKKIAFQGEPGANSHLAIHEAYPDHEAVPTATFEDAFAAVTTGDCDLAMIPIENSVAGPSSRHPPPDAGFKSAHRCRAFYAGAAPVARTEGREA